MAVVDPPRGGLHPKVVRALRECKAIDRLVYVSCNPTGTFVDDAIKLCLPTRCGGKWSTGEPFLPLRAAPVDMFPDTKHCELVVVFSRESSVSRAGLMPNDNSIRDVRQAEQECSAKRKRCESAEVEDVVDESVKKIAKTSAD